MEISTKRLGVITIDETHVLHFSKGLIGFPDHRKFVVIDLDKSGIFKWLQSLDDESLGFVIIDPKIAFKNYDPVFSPKDLEPLGAPHPNQLVLLSVVTVPDDIKQMTVNLLAPLVVNPRKRFGKQVITADPTYNTKHYVFGPLKDLIKRTG